MASLFASAPEGHQRWPSEIRAAIQTLKAEYSAFRPNELATICQIRYGHRPSPHTVNTGLG
jgi:hypothetical protein